MGLNEGAPNRQGYTDQCPQELVKPVRASGGGLLWGQGSGDGFRFQGLLGGGILARDRCFTPL